MSRSTDLPLRRWTAREYYQLAEHGILRGQRARLINGEILDMPAHGHPHFQTLDHVADLLAAGFGPGVWVRRQGPVEISDVSVPEPDITVVRGSRDDYDAHPRTAILAVEVSDSTLRLDRLQAGLYASAAIEEYWILDLKSHRLELFRNPIEDLAAEFGWRYAQQRTLEASETLAPLAKPQLTIQVRDLFPVPKVSA